MKTQLTELIAQRIAEEKDQAKISFLQEHPIQVARHFVVDNLLPTEIAEQVYACFPNPKKMRLLSQYGQIKLRYGYIKKAAKLLQDVNSAIQSPQVIEQIEAITGLQQQIADPTRFGGGITTLQKGHFIHPHVDSSHDVEKQVFRTLNVLYYVSPNWCLENGGNYELWDEKVLNRIVVPCLFNRLLVMETNSRSWHSVNPVLCDKPRCCLFNYYFSKQSPEGDDYYNFPSIINPLFRQRPENKIRRKIADLRIKYLTKIPS